MSNLLNDILALKPGQSVVLKDFNIRRHVTPVGGGYFVTHRNTFQVEMFRAAAEVVMFLEKQPSPPPKETMPINSDLIESLSPGWSTDIQGFKIRRNTDGSYSVFKKGIAQGWAFQEAHELVTFLESTPPEYLQVWGRATRPQEEACAPPSLVVTRKEIDNIISSVLRGVAELPDRTSPKDCPEAMLVTTSELEEILYQCLNEATNQNGSP